VREKAVRFGTTAPLVGVVTEPLGQAVSPERPAVIFLNSGILHHVGACRMYVNAARALAARGFTVMRFDHAGIGDSEVRREAMPFEQGAIIDTRDAMSHLTSTKGAQKFVLMGLCSGADMSFRVAGQDPRVVGLVQLDAWAYRTAGYYLRHYGKRARDLGAWTRFAGRLARKALRRGASAAVAERGADTVGAEYRRKFPPREDVARDLGALLDRGTRMLYLFSGGQEEHYNYREQYRASFRSVNFRDQVRVEYLPDADHLFSGLEHQRFVIEAMTEWMTTHWSAVPARREVAAAAPPRPLAGVSAGR
jgi:hypothetical protein